MGKGTAHVMAPPMYLRVMGGDGDVALRQLADAGIEAVWPGGFRSTGTGQGPAHGVSLAGRARATTSNRWKKRAGKESPVPARLLHLR